MLRASADASAAAVYVLEPRVSVTETYDDNVDRVNRDRRDDWITSLGAGLTGSSFTERFSGSAAYRLGVSFFANESDRQGESTHAASLAVTYRATEQLTLHLADGLVYAETTETQAAGAIPAPPLAGAPGPEPAPPPEALDPAATSRGRVRRLANAASAGAEYAPFRDTTLDGSYSHELVEYGRDLVDSQTHRASVGVSRQLGRQSRARLGYAAAFFEFDSADRDDRVSQTVSVRWDRDFGEGVTAGAGVGVTWTDPGDVEVAPVGEASIEKRVGLTRYSARASSAVTASDGTGEVQRTDAARLGIGRELSMRLSAEAGVGYSRRERLESGASSATHVFSASAGLAVVLSRRVTGRLAYGFEREDAPSGMDSFRNNRATATISVALPGARTRRF